MGQPRSVFLPPAGLCPHPALREGAPLRHDLSGTPRQLPPLKCTQLTTAPVCRMYDGECPCTVSLGLPGMVPPTLPPRVEAGPSGLEEQPPCCSGSVGPVWVPWARVCGAQRQCQAEPSLPSPAEGGGFWPSPQELAGWLCRGSRSTPRSVNLWLFTFDDSYCFITTRHPGLGPVWSLAERM